MIDRREETAERVVKFWPVILALFMALGAYLRMQWQVAQMQEQMESYKVRSDTQRDRRNEEMENIRLRIAKLELWTEFHARK